MSNDLTPYWQGFYAPQKRLTEDDCPYPAGTQAHAEWMEGFKEASQADEV
jgi:ribosome modulation factor